MVEINKVDLVMKKMNSDTIDEGGVKRGWQSKGWGRWRWIGG